MTFDEWFERHGWGDISAKYSARLAWHAAVSECAAVAKHEADKQAAIEAATDPGSPAMTIRVNMRLTAQAIEAAVRKLA